MFCVVIGTKVVLVPMSYSEEKKLGGLVTSSLCTLTSDSTAIGRSDGTFPYLE